MCFMNCERENNNGECRGPIPRVCPHEVEELKEKIFKKLEYSKNIIPELAPDIDFILKRL
jgi:hypothetical protein